MIWVMLGTMAIVTAVLLAVGPPRRSEPLKRKDGALAILKDQLAEIDSDQERNLISATEAIAAKIEIKRRMLTASRLDGRGPSSTTGHKTILASAIALPLASLSVYSLIGSPYVESQPFVARVSETEEAAKLSELTQRLKTRLETDEAGGSVEGWILLGRTYMRIERYNDAIDAFEHVATRDDADSGTLSLFAEALIAAEKGNVTPKAARVIDQALEMNPSNPAAVFFKAQAMEQDGAAGPARTLLIERLGSADRAYPWVEVFIAAVNRLGEQTGDSPVSPADFVLALQDKPGPNRADIAAAQNMSIEERSVFIKSMVDRLAERLSKDPDDLEGWLRLAESYSVLGNPDAAENAAGQARKLANNLPEADPMRAAAMSRLDQITN